MGIYNLEKIFEPDSVAVVGASEKSGSIGSAVVTNLMEGGYPGRIIPVHPKYRRVHGLDALESLNAVDGEVDLAVIATPIATVPDIIETCVEKELGAAIVLSAGGREAGDKGREIEAEIEEKARTGGLRILGPNCLGVIAPGSKLNASFAPQMPAAGKIAFVSQSGAICTAMLDLSLKEHIGYSHFISTGSMLDIDFGDLIDYLGNEAQVDSILLYIESLTNFRKFMSAARAVSRIKPIIALKAGKSKAGSRAAASHTGAMTGEDAVYDAAFKRAGITRVGTLGEFFDCAELLAKQKPPAGPKVVVITNAGGPGVMAADSISEAGLDMSPLPEKIEKRLDDILPPFWSKANPIDILGDAGVDRYAETIRCCFDTGEFDGMLVIVNPQAMTKPEALAEKLADILKERPYLVVTSLMGGVEMENAVNLLNQAGLPTYDTPERAVKAFMYLHQYARNLEELQQIPPKIIKELDVDYEKALAFIQSRLEQGEGFLTEVESRELLKAYGIRVNPVQVASSSEECVQMSEEMGYPVVMKILSPDIVHKTDAGGVATGLRSPEAVSEAYLRLHDAARQYAPGADLQGVTIQPMIEGSGLECFIGGKMDTNFGPIVMFGMGGIYAEVLQDRAIGLPPMNRLLAGHLMENTRVYQLLKGYRNRRGVDLVRMEEMLIRFSELLMDFPEIDEADLNPLFSEGEPCVVDARISLKQSAIKAPMHMAISPYPSEYECHLTTEEGRSVFLRPIKPEDAPALENLFETLSPTTIYYRFFGAMKSISHKMLARFTQIDYDREIAMVAFDSNGQVGDEILAVGRIIGDPDGRRGEFAIVVGDPWQGQGIGAAVLQKCIEIAEERGFEHIEGPVLAENNKMLKLGRKLGFEVLQQEGEEYQLRLDF